MPTEYKQQRIDDDDDDDDVCSKYPAPCRTRAYHLSRRRVLCGSGDEVGYQPAAPNMKNA